MKDDKGRRIFIKNIAPLSACLFLAPEIVPSFPARKNNLMARRFGKINFDVTTMGLGGQASLQWTPSDVDPVKIIEKAFKMGINYYDTSNVYGPSIGTPTLNLKELVRYTVSTYGVPTTIIGLGEINDDPEKCQLSSNLDAAQIRWGELPQTERKKIESTTARINMGKTNGFQESGNQLVPPGKVSVRTDNKKKKFRIKIQWHTADAGASPLNRYEIYRNDQLVETIPFKPQTTKKPYQYTEVINQGGKYKYVVSVVDGSGQKAFSEPVWV